jgi:hypothetical protein
VRHPSATPQTLGVDRVVEGKGLELPQPVALRAPTFPRSVLARSALRADGEGEIQRFMPPIRAAFTTPHCAGSARLRGAANAADGRV